jgi:hypothetical protein
VVVIDAPASPPYRGQILLVERRNRTAATIRDYSQAS